MKILILNNNINTHSISELTIFLSKLPLKLSFEVIDAKTPPYVHSSYDALILSGSAQSMFSNEPWVLHLINFLQIECEKKKKILGICFGHQIIARMFGAQGILHEKKEGVVQIHTDHSRLFLDKSTFYACRGHCEQVILLPKQLKVTAYSDDVPIQAFEHEQLPIFGIQFHVELATTDALFQPEICISIMRNFLLC